jgi:hypothetical protein
MSNLLEFKKRLRREKHEALRDKGFEVRDCRESFYVMDQEYVREYAKECGLAASSIYMLLCCHVGKEQVCYPGNEYMAKMLDVSERTVMRAIRDLEARKIIKVDRVKGEGNIYTLLSKRQWRKSSFLKHDVRDNTKPNFNMMCGDCGNKESTCCLECVGASQYEKVINRDQQG